MDDGEKWERAQEGWGKRHMMGTQTYSHITKEWWEDV